MHGDLIMIAHPSAAGFVARPRRAAPRRGLFVKSTCGLARSMALSPAVGVGVVIVGASAQSGKSLY